MDKTTHQELESATSKQTRRPRIAWRLPLILLLAFSLRLSTVLWLSDTVPYTDYGFYHMAGEKISQDFGFFFDSEQTHNYGKFGWWPPLYPFSIGLVYSIIGVHHRVIVFLQVILGTILCGLMYRLGKRAANERVGWIAALLVALNPTYVFVTNLLASENLFIVLLAMGLLSQMHASSKPRGWIAAGCFYAWAALTRAVGLLVPVITVLALRNIFSSRRQWLRAAGFLLAATTLVIAPWTLRNWVVVGKPAIICFGGGLNFYYGHNEVSIGYRDLSLTPMSQLATQQAIDEMGYDLGWRYLAQHPASLITSSFHKINSLFAPPFYAPHSSSAIMLPDGWRSDPKAGQVAREMRARQRAKNKYLDGLFTNWAAWHTYAILFGALASLVFWRRMSLEMKLFAYLSAYWVLSHAMFWGKPRFRFPLEFFLSLLAAFALEMLLSKRRKGILHG